MSVGLLVITHDQLGSQLLQTATNMLEICPLNAKAIAVHSDEDPDRVVQRAQNMMDELDESDGVLIMTDIFGSTPSNIECW